MSCPGSKASWTKSLIKCRLPGCWWENVTQYLIEAFHKSAFLEHRIISGHLKKLLETLYLQEKCWCVFWVFLSSKLKSSNFRNWSELFFSVRNRDYWQQNANCCKVELCATLSNSTLQQAKRCSDIRREYRHNKQTTQDRGQRQKAIDSKKPFNVRLFRSASCGIAVCAHKASRSIFTGGDCGWIRTMHADSNPSECCCQMNSCNRKAWKWKRLAQMDQPFESD